MGDEQAACRGVWMSEWSRALATPAALADLVRDAYALDVVQVRLVRSFVNDVYAIDCASGRFALKVYRHDGWAPDEVAWEQDLVCHVARHGVPVPTPVPRADGLLAGEMEYPEGLRSYALLPWMSGSKPRPDDATYAAFGELMASFHAASETFSTDHQRRPFAIGPDLDDPLAEVWEHLTPGSTECDLVRELARHARSRLVGFADRGGDWGSATATCRWTTSSVAQPAWCCTIST